MGFFEAVRSVFSKYFEFSGRALRSEYWYWALFLFIVGIPVGVLSLFWLPIYFIWSIGLFFPNLAVSVRRLHDSDYSGWWVLIGIIPIINFLLLYWLIIKGDSYENRFGMPPIGSKSNQSSAARAARSSEPIPSEPIPSESRAARAARSSAASSNKPKDLYFDNRRSPSKKNPPDEPDKKDSSQENPSKDISSEADDLYFDNRRKK